MECEVCGDVARYAMDQETGETFLCGVKCQRKFLGAAGMEKRAKSKKPIHRIPVVSYENAIFPKNPMLAPLKPVPRAPVVDAKLLTLFFLCERAKANTDEHVASILRNIKEFKETCHFLAVILVSDHESTGESPPSFFKEIAERGIPIFNVDIGNIEQVKRQMLKIIDMIFRVHDRSNYGGNVIAWLSRTKFVHSSFTPSICFWNNAAKLDAGDNDEPDFNLRITSRQTPSSQTQLKGIGITSILFEDMSDENDAFQVFYARQIFFVLVVKHRNQNRNWFQLAESKTRLPRDLLYNRDIVLVHLYNREKKSTNSRKLASGERIYIDEPGLHLASKISFPWIPRQRGAYLNIGVRKTDQDTWVFEERDLHAMKDYATGIRELPLQYVVQ